jgi:hypothetical protein
MSNRNYSNNNDEYDWDIASEDEIDQHTIQKTTSDLVSNQRYNQKRNDFEKSQDSKKKNGNVQKFYKETDTSFKKNSNKVDKRHETTSKGYLIK